MVTTMQQREFNERRFRQQMDAALKNIKKVLDDTKIPSLYEEADDVDHTYDDKFRLAEFLTNSAMAAQWNVLKRLGLLSGINDDNDKILKVLNWANEDPRVVTLRFDTKETCEFVKESTKSLEGPVSVEKEEMTTSESTKTTKKLVEKMVVTTVKECWWDCGIEYKLLVYVGSYTNSDDPDETSHNRCILLKKGRIGSLKVTTAGRDHPPFASTTTRCDPLEVDLTWLLRQTTTTTSTRTTSSSSSAPDGDGGQEESENENEGRIQCSFSIDRGSPSCHTPRCNHDTADAVEFFESIRRWADNVKHRVCMSFVPIGRHRPTISSSGILVPVLPLFKEKNEPRPVVHVTDDDEKDRISPGDGTDARSGDGSNPLMPRSDINLLLQEQGRSLDREIAGLQEAFPSNVNQKFDGSAAAAFASIALLASHTESICLHFLDGVDYIDYMLHTQLIAAIGKEVKPVDFEEFLQFHGTRKLFRKEYAPEPFCYAIRRPGHYPDGTISIQRDADTIARDGRDLGPICTLTCKIQRDEHLPMFMPINAATNVAFSGEHFLHGWVLPAFDTRKVGGGNNNGSPGYNLVARARQFSSFMLVLGKISGPESFQPEHAIVLQNKDEVLLPLLLQQLPSPREFKDAIKSLSPNQQRFATCFRSMQLESSTVGICVIQLKPQLEVLLGLPADSLTKEIQLSESLLSLFIEYQVPSDLLSFDGDQGASPEDKVARVKKHVAAVQTMIAQSKEAELADAKQAADMRAEEARMTAEMGTNTFPTLEKWGREEKQEAEEEEEEVADLGGGDMFGGGVERCVFKPKQVPVADNNMSTMEGQEDDYDLIGGKKPSDLPDAVDFTLIPKQLDDKYEALDEDSALRPTTIKIGEVWKKVFQKSLSVKKSSSIMLGDEEQKQEKDQAFGLLDGLSRSGSLPIASAELHVVVAATHSFAKSLMATVVQDDTNPIDKIERSLVIVASTIHGGVKVPELLKNDSQVARLAHHSPQLLSQSESIGSGDGATTRARQEEGVVSRREHTVLTFSTEPQYEYDIGDY